MSTGPLQSYRDLIVGHHMVADPAQLDLAALLDALARALAAWKPRRGWPLSMLGAAPSPPRGIYIHGAVGRGKTMLMDLFHASVHFKPRRRVHFHEFMADVHERIAAARQKVSGDTIPEVARGIAAEARLLCFDEMHVTDIADAMILGRLFETLFNEGVVVVATSNSAPSELYRNGLNRQLFLPFIAMLQRNLDVRELKSVKDYRLEKLAGQKIYFTPADAAADAAIRRVFAHLTGVERGEPEDLLVKGRHVRVPEAAMGVARFRFDDLCEAALGPLDYLSLAHAYHTVLLEGVPRLTPDRRNAARRFINLIDTLYDSRTCLIVTADAEPSELYPAGDGAILFERTASRLIEMRSESYLADRQARAAGSGVEVGTLALP